MAARDLPNLELKAFFDIGENGWDDEMSLNLLKLSVLTQGGVKSRVAALPGSPTAGDVHILTTDGSVQVRDDGAWVEFTPKEGWLLYDRDTNEYVTFDGADWNVLATGGGGGGVEEAPEDGTPYARQDGDWVPVAAGGGGGGSLAKITQIVLGSDSATLDFTDIAGDYEDLILVVTGRGTAAANTADATLVFNGDVVSDYAFQNIAGSSTAYNGYGATGITDPCFCGRIPAATAPADLSSHFVIEIPSYARTQFAKSFTSKGGSRGGGSAGDLFGINMWGDWANTDAITDIQLALSAGNFAAGTIATLYGRGGVGAAGAGTLRGARVHLDADYARSSGESSILSPTSVVEYDTDGWWNTAEQGFVVPAGVSYVVFDAQRATNSNSGLRLYKNATLVALVGDVGQTFIYGSTAAIPCVAGDIFYPKCYSSGGYTLDADEPSFTWASIRAVEGIGGGAAEVDPLTAQQFLGSFDKWDTAKARGASAPARCVIMGDSNVMATGVTGHPAGAFTKGFARTFADAMGWQTGSIYANQNVGNMATYRSFNPTVTSVTGGWQVATGGADVMGGTFFTSASGAGGTFTWTPDEEFRYLKFVWPQNPGLNGATVVKIDGVTVDTINQAAGAASVLAADYDAGSLGAHTVTVSCSGSGDSYLQALEISDGTDTPIYVQAGWSGAKAADLAKTSSAWSALNQLALLDFDYGIIYCTINDAAAETAGNTYYAAMEALVRTVSATGDGCIILGFPADAGGTVSSYLNNLAVMLKQLALDYGWSYYDARQFFGHSWKVANDRGLAFDTHHPDDDGHDGLRDALVDFLGPKL